MIESNAAVPNGLMKAIRRSTPGSRSITSRPPLPGAAGRDGLERRAVEAERSRIDDRRTAADEIRDEAARRRTRGVAEDVATGHDDVIEAGEPIDDRQAVRGHRQDPGPGTGEAGGLERRDRGTHALRDERHAREVRAPVEPEI